MNDFDNIGYNLRGLYFGYFSDEGEADNTDLVKLSPETILFWRRVAKIQKASGVSKTAFINAQLRWFSDHDMDPYSLEAVETLVTEWALKRARFSSSLEARKEQSAISSVPEESAELARRSYERAKAVHFPQDGKTYSIKSDVWKRLVLAAEKSHESLDKFVEAGFIYAVRERLKCPPPQLLASEEGLRRSSVVNRTILNGPSIKKDK